MTRHALSISGTQTLLSGCPLLVRGLRTSNALISDATTDDLIACLDEYTTYGVNAVSVYFQGSRFGDVKGYREDGSPDPVYAGRMGRIIEAADARAMVVLVGCLYWGNSRARWAHWTQADANAAVSATVRWLRDNDYRNVLVDVDNEGMAQREAGFDDRALLLAGKAEWPECPIATNYRGAPPPEADLAIHHSDPAPGKPYIETEGSPPGVPGGYWGPYSKQEGLYGYLNVGVYTEEMKEAQRAATLEHLRAGRGYMFASTWLQAPPPQGPNHRPGGDGTPGAPGVRWWLEFLRDHYGTYRRA